MIRVFALSLLFVATLAMPNITSAQTPKTIAEVVQTTKPLALRDLQLGREFSLSSSETQTTVNATARVPKPAIVTREQWQAKPTSGTIVNHFPAAVTIHHGGDKPLAPDADTASLVRNLQTWSQTQKGWCDIPYHFMIDLNGTIYEARPWDIRGDTNTAYDTNKHLLIELIGNYEEQAPSMAQLNAICDLTAWVCDYFNIPPETIAGHKDYTSTLCPGTYVYPYVLSGWIEGQVRKKIQTAYTIKH
ncbi:hypothetical protein GX645_05705 [Candidatus Sumerlaeota bacterium]|nr:N-acetylmuramoyl-L-alanine amidase [Candidatus Sumerlaeales bacterium]NLD61932.1 hypothetical protein [Candidatus Sumerlaeota bacterium]